MRLRPTLNLAMCPWVVTASLVTAADSATEDALTLELQVMAGDFAKIVDTKGGGAVAIGEFSASADVKASAGPRIQLVLASELKKLKAPIHSENYRFEIKGDYQPLIDKESGILGIKLVGRLIDRETAESLAEKGRFVFGPQVVPAMLGLNTHTRPTDDAKSLSNEFKRAKNNPRADVHGTAVRSTSDSLFAMEILVKSDMKYTAREIKTDELGRPLVPINKDEVYGVRLINRSDYEAAADLQIDGINVFAFSGIQSQYWIIAPHKQVEVLGWHKSETASLEFKVTEFPETAVARLNLRPSSSIGLITACFSAAWENDNRPVDEPVVKGRGTGFGAEIQVNTNQVKRTIGRVRDTISVRYER